MVMVNVLLCISCRFTLKQQILLMRDGKEVGSLVLSGTSLHCYCSVLSAIYGPHHKALSGNLEFQNIVTVLHFIILYLMLLWKYSCQWNQSFSIQGHPNLQHWNLTLGIISSTAYILSGYAKLSKAFLPLPVHALFLAKEHFFPHILPNHPNFSYHPVCDAVRSSCTSLFCWPDKKKFVIVNTSFL